MQITLASAALALAGTTFAQTIHDVKVKPGELAFEPSSLSNVAQGDKIRVAFDNNIPHDAVSGSFDQPCQYNSQGGVNSGVHTASAGVFVFTVNSTDPSVYYCSVGSHCQAGMAFVVNPSGDNTYDKYASGATSTTSGDPTSDGPSGGVLEAANASSGSASGSASSSSSSPSSAATASTASSSPSSSGSRTSAASTGAAASRTPSSSGAAPSQTAGSSASSLDSAFAMVGALVAGAAALVM